MTATVPTLTVSERVWVLLSAIDHVNVFDGEPRLPEYDPGDAATHDFWDLDDAGNVVGVHAYAAFYPSPGVREARTVSGQPSSLAWSFQVTCVGLDRSTALWCVDKITSALTGLPLVIPGRRNAARIREIGDPGPVRIDRDVTPHRSYSPLDFGVYL